MWKIVMFSVNTAAECGVLVMGGGEGALIS